MQAFAFDAAAVGLKLQPVAGGDLHFYRLYHRKMVGVTIADSRPAALLHEADAALIGPGNLAQIAFRITAIALEEEHGLSFLVIAGIVFFRLGPANRLVGPQQFALFQPPGQVQGRADGIVGRMNFVPRLRDDQRGFAALQRRKVFPGDSLAAWFIGQLADAAEFFEPVVRLSDALPAAACFTAAR